MARGRKRMPTATHEASGAYDRNPNRRPVNEPQPTMGAPPIPAKWTKNKRAREVWDMVVSWLDDLGISSKADAGLIEHYVSHYVIAEQAWDDIQSRGVMIDGARSGDKVKNPAVGIHRSELAACEKILPEFGLSPSSRSKVQTIGPASKPGSKIEAFRARIAG